MTQDDFDLEKFVDLFDTAMSSDNPTVKRAFKNLMMVAALVEAENNPSSGPLRSLLEEITQLKQRIAILENRTQVFGPVGATGPNYSGLPVTWISTTSSGYPVNTGATTGTIATNNTAPKASTNYTSSFNYKTIYDTLESKN